MYTGKLIKLVREYREEDVKFSIEDLHDSKKTSFPFVPFPFAYNDNANWIEQIVFNDNYNFAIETLSDRKYIGTCGLRNLDMKNRCTEIGIFIGNSKYFFDGYGIDAMLSLINFIFVRMDLNKIKFNVNELNKKAIRFYERCGFKKEGVLKDEICINGKYYDVIRMAILKDNFLSMKGVNYGKKN